MWHQPKIAFMLGTSIHSLLSLIALGRKREKSALPCLSSTMLEAQREHDASVRPRATFAVLSRRPRRITAFDLDKNNLEMRRRALFRCVPARDLFELQSSQPRRVTRRHPAHQNSQSASAEMV